MRFLKFMLKIVIIIAIVLCIVWLGLNIYFSNIDRIADKVRSDVMVSLQEHHSEFLEYKDIPEMYRDAIIATEDRSFFTNIGVDFGGILRAVFVNVGSGQILQGGSTITQQLVHNTILSGTEKSITWKILESIDAIGLYDTMGKEETFALYTNVIYFGHGAWGLRQAADVYFGKAPSELNNGELTMLVGLPNAPSVYDPFSNMTLARQRQQLVIESMVDAGVISESEGEQIFKEPINLKD